MKDCGIVKDLLPLVAEDMASNETKAFVAAHIETCEACKKELKALKSPVETDPAAPLKSVRKSVKRHGWLIAGLIACLSLAVCIGIFARITRPIAIHTAEDAFISVKLVPMDYNSDLAASEEDEEDENIENPVVSVPIICETSEGLALKLASKPGVWDQALHEGNVVSISAYTTVLDRWFLNVPHTSDLIIPLEDVDAVYLEPYNNTERVLLFAREGYTGESGFALRRLVMNYYLAIAVMLSVILFVPWLILAIAKKRRARRIVGTILLVPLCFAISFLLMGYPASVVPFAERSSTTLFYLWYYHWRITTPLRDLIYSLMMAPLLIGAGLCGRTLLGKE